MDDMDNLELVSCLLERLRIRDQDWHRLKADPQARAQEQVAAALVFLVRGNHEEALSRLKQAAAWLEGSLSAPPCGGGHNPRLPSRY